MVIADTSGGCVERALYILGRHSSLFVSQDWICEWDAIDFSSQKFSIIFARSGTVFHVRAFVVQMVLLQELLEPLVASHFHKFELSLIPDIHSAGSDE